MQKHVGTFGISDKRGRTATSTDPYQTPLGSNEPARCSQCQAVYLNKRWQQESSATTEKKASHKSELRSVVCPACRKTADGYVQGVMTLRGSYLWTHVTEICNLLRHAEERVRVKNPLERILRMEQEGDTLVIETTADKLVEHLGRALHKAHQGELHVTWNDGHEACRVQWARQ